MKIKSTSTALARWNLSCVKCANHEKRLLCKILYTRHGLLFAFALKKKPVGFGLSYDQFPSRRAPSGKAHLCLQIYKWKSIVSFSAPENLYPDSLDLCRIRLRMSSIVDRVVLYETYVSPRVRMASHLICLGWMRPALDIIIIYIFGERCNNR